MPNWQAYSEQVIAAFADIAEAQSASSMYLLRDIEHTCRNLDRISEIGRLLEKDATHRSEQLAITVLAGQIDSTGNLVSKLAKVQDVIGRFVNELREGKRAANADRDLRDSNLESVIDAYDKAIDSFTHLFSAIEDLRLSVLEHDADQSDITEKFDNVDSLLESLK
jgi:hypothetical protein